MTDDKVTLMIGNREIDKFISYRIENDMFSASDGFNFQVLPIGLDDLSGGQACQIFINNRQELKGIITGIEETSDKEAGDTLTISGTDLLGELTRQPVEEFITFEDFTLEELVKQLLKPKAFEIGIPAVFFASGSKNKVIELKTQEKKINSFKEKQTAFQVSPGQSLFDIFQEVALSLGLLFFSLPSGSLVFSPPKTSGSALFTLDKFNIKAASRLRSTANRHSSVKIISQKKEPTTLKGSVDDFNVTGEVTDADFPEAEKLPFARPLIRTARNTSADPQEQARVIMAREIYESQALSFTVANHVDPRTRLPWQTNDIVKITYDYPKASGNHLFINRAFSMTKETGPITELAAARLGALPI